MRKFFTTIAIASLASLAFATPSASLSVGIASFKGTDRIDTSYCSASYGSYNIQGTSVALNISSGSEKLPAELSSEAIFATGEWWCSSSASAGFGFGNMTVGAYVSYEAFSACDEQYKPDCQYLIPVEIEGANRNFWNHYYGSEAYSNSEAGLQASASTHAGFLDMTFRGRVGYCFDDNMEIPVGNCVSDIKLGTISTALSAEARVYAGPLTVKASLGIESWQMWDFADRDGDCVGINRVVGRFCPVQIRNTADIAVDARISKDTVLTVRTRHICDHPETPWLGEEGFSTTTGRQNAYNDIVSVSLSKTF